MIDDPIIEQLIQEFTTPRSEFEGKSYLQRRREWFKPMQEEIKPLLDKEKLAELTVDEAQKIYNEMSVGGPRLYPISFIENGIEKIRKSFRYLLYGDDPIEERFYSLVDNPESEYWLNGIGRSYASTALLVLDSQEFGIWNGAIDEGLKMLDMLPKREKGEHKGKTYVKIVSVLKELQQRCGFEDLSLTDEFVELIGRHEIGADILPIEPTPPVESEEQEEEPQTHLRMQYFLVKIGVMEGYDVWVAKNDMNKEYNGEKFANLCLNEIPQFSAPNVIRIAELIDCIWFKKNTAQPVYFFEIEHTTSIYSGLLRLNDVRTDYPIPKAYIVAEETRKSNFESQINRRTFSMSELNEICRFMNYDKVEKWYECLEEIQKIKEEI